MSLLLKLILIGNILEVDSPLGNNPENDPFMGQPVMADILKKEVEEPNTDMQNAPLPPELIEKLVIFNQNQ